MTRLIGLFALAALLLLPLGFAQPLTQAHAHNDYEHERPLLDALSHSFLSVEADIWLVDGELLVAHDEDEVTPERTLESLYLEPLSDRVEENGGSVYPDSDAPLTLLIDIKSEGEATYDVLDEVLRAYAGMLTRFAEGATEPGAVTVIISGERPRETMEAQTERFAGYDGRLEDLGTDAPASFIPLISDNWTNIFSWMGEGEMPEAERAELTRIVETAHAAGQRVRFWATPDEAGASRTALWQVLLEAGVDHINTDDLAGLEAFLRK